ncbi:MAG: hypothetical protein KY464_05345 [Gemmatimonadetes bacterium]|nr:hypothetical protein [Gemmatimonadota bacterium]
MPYAPTALALSRYRTHRSHLILSRSGPLPATHATHEARIERGRIYVAPPDHHLLVRNGVMELSRAARENRTRPAADPLFRSAAQAYRSRGERARRAVRSPSVTFASERPAAGMLRALLPSCPADPRSGGRRKPDTAGLRAMWDQRLPDPAQRGVDVRRNSDSGARVYGRAIDCGGRRAETERIEASGHGRGPARSGMTDGHFPRG